MKPKRLTALTGCLFLIGCGLTGSITDEFTKNTNPFGFAFQDRDEVLALIPTGTPVDKAQATLRMHGYEQSSIHKQADELILFFHRPDLGGLRDASKDQNITIHCRMGKVVDIEFREPGK